MPYLDDALKNKKHTARRSTILFHDLFLAISCFHLKLYSVIRDKFGTEMEDAASLLRIDTPIADWCISDLSGSCWGDVLFSCALALFADSPC